MDNASDQSNLKNAVLVIAGHGSSRNPASAGPTYRLAETLSGKNIFRRVVPAFVKQEPKLADVLAGVLNDGDVDDVVIVPNMTCRGYITTDVIPRDADLSGPLTERKSPDGHPQRIHLTDPIGTDPRMTRAILSEIEALMKGNGLGAAETGILLIGHGSEKSRESSNQTAALADAVLDAGIAGETATAFLEEPPAIPGAAQRMQAEKVIAVPFLIAPGLHGADDIPAELGIQNAKDALSNLHTDGAAGPFTTDGKALWYLRPIGESPVIADIVIDRARDVLKKDA